MENTKAPGLAVMIPDVDRYTTFGKNLAEMEVTMRKIYDRGRDGTKKR